MLIDADASGGRRRPAQDTPSHRTLDDAVRLLPAEAQEPSDRKRGRFAEPGDRQSLEEQCEM